MRRIGIGQIVGAPNGEITGQISFIPESLGWQHKFVSSAKEIAYCRAESQQNRASWEPALVLDWLRSALLKYRKLAQSQEI